jgi:uncharacterized protein with ATP-grasp and redox domains
MVEPGSLPEFIGCRDPASFGFHTVKHRLPKILSQARAGLDAVRAADPRLDELLDDVVTGGPVRPQHFAPATAFWDTYLDSVLERPWSELPFFDTEFCFYQAINSIAGAFDSNIDVFAGLKLQALTDAVAALGVASTASPATDSMSDLITRATSGNMVDLSRPGLPHAQRFLVDDRALLSKALSQPNDCVHIILDNAGSELCADLILSDRLLQEDTSQLVLHAKPWPMFVSDAVVQDVERSVERFCDGGAGVGLQAVGARLRAAKAGGRLSIEAHTSFGEPRHFGNLAEDLALRLGEASVVIAKGDLNYRRFIEDRAWPAETPLALANRASFSAFALRVLKSEALAGVPPSTVQTIAREDPDYRINGRYAMVQHAEGASGLAPLPPT